MVIIAQVLRDELGQVPADVSASLAVLSIELHQLQDWVVRIFCIPNGECVSSMNTTVTILTSTNARAGIDSLTGSRGQAEEAKVVEDHVNGAPSRNAQR